MYFVIHFYLVVHVKIKIHEPDFPKLYVSKYINTLIY